jgi:hypothetical protein
MGLLLSVSSASAVPFCAASFCGSFAGMSAQTVTLGQASLLAFFTSVVYYIFERPNQKLQVGKGGRLGTIAFLANVFYYFAIRNGGSSSHQFGGSAAAASFFVDIVKLLRPSTTVAVVLAATVLNMARSRRIRDQKQQQQQQQQQAISQEGSGGISSSTAVEKPRSNGVVAQMLLATVSKGAIITALLARCLLQTTATTGSGSTTTATAATVTTLVALAKSTLAMFAASVTVQKCKPLVVFPVALIGLMSATLLGNSWAAPLYLGAFIGMTGLPQFTLSRQQPGIKFLQASLLSALLLQLGLFAGFGGKLGFLAFVGVNFAL